MNRKIIVSLCVVWAIAGMIILGIWWKTNAPGSKELEYRTKQETASQKASTALESARSSTDRDIEVAQMSERQSADQEARRFLGLANLEMNRRTVRNERLLSAAAFFGLLCIATAAVLFLPRERE